MANDLKLADAAANASADAACAQCNSGKLRIYDGSKPANANTAVSTQNLLAELAFGSTAFGSASGGAAGANTITAAAAGASGTAAWFRAVKSDGTTAVFDGTVGTSGCDLNLAAVAIAAGATVEVDSLTYTQPE